MEGGKRRRLPVIEHKPPTDSSFRWHKKPRIENNPNYPPSRLCHTTTEIDSNRFILFGGWTGVEERSSEVHIYSTDSDEWTLVECQGEVPCPRSTHSLTPFDNGRKLVLFGGYKGDEIRLNDMYLLDTASFCWKELKAKGPSPPPRNTHTATLIAGGTKLLIFGGRDEYTFFSDVWILDISTWTWKEIESKEPRPAGRSGHSAVVIRNNNVLVFGGWAGSMARFNDLWEFDIGSETWIEHETTGGPCPRSGHTACLLNESEMLVFGGWGPNTYRHDVHILDMEKMLWRRVRPAGALPEKRRFHSMVMVGGKVYMFGGKNNEDQYDDLWILHFGPPSLLARCIQAIVKDFALHSASIHMLSESLQGMIEEEMGVVGSMSENIDDGID